MNLPTIAYAQHPANPGQVVAIKINEFGYYPIETTCTAAELNETAGITKAQVEAMVTGSMFGWGCPGANPDNYDENGKFIRKQQW